MEQSSKKDRKKSLIAILIVLLCILFMKTFIFRPMVKEKTDLTDADIKTISEELQMSGGNFNITRLFFSHAQESVYVVDTETSDISELRKHYNIEENDTFGKGIAFKNKSNYNLDCVIIEKDTALYDVSFHYYGNNKQFDKILGNYSYLLEDLFRIMP